jgi:hypothetical protein
MRRAKMTQTIKSLFKFLLLSWNTLTLREFILFYTVVIVFTSLKLILFIDFDAFWIKLEAMCDFLDRVNEEELATLRTWLNAKLNGDDTNDIQRNSENGYE